MGLLDRGKKKKRKAKSSVKPGTVKKAAIKKAVKHTKKKDDEQAIVALKGIIRETDQKLTRNHILFLSEYIRNGCHGRRAYQFIFPNTSKPTAECQASNWLRKINLPNLLHLSGLGWGQIVTDLKALSSDRRLFYLIQLHKLNSLQVDINQKMTVTVVMPPKAPELEAPPKEIIVKRKKKAVKKKGGKNDKGIKK